MNKFIPRLVLLGLSVWQMQSHASGIAIDKVYLPYVEPLEHELEYRVMRYKDNDSPLDNVQKHKLAYGQALSERWFGEVYIVGSNPDNGDFDTDSYEVEIKWQATEQGEFQFDVGFLFEFEREQEDDARELSAAMLLTTDIGRVTASSNIFLIVEDGKELGRETEMAANFQFLYRLSPHFEPAIEIYLAQDTFGIGPMIMGTERLATGKKLHWEFGIIAGLLDDMPDTTIKGLLEYEF